MQTQEKMTRTLATRSDGTPGADRNAHSHRGSSSRNINLRSRRAVFGAVIAAAAVATVAAPTDAVAYWRGGWYGWHGGWGWAPEAVAGGVVAGAVVGSALAAPRYYYPYAPYPYGRCVVWNGYAWVRAC
jgi:hypothetical protein